MRATLGATKGRLIRCTVSGLTPNRSWRSRCSEELLRVHAHMWPTRLRLSTASPSLRALTMAEASGLRLLGCGGFAVGQESSRDVEVITWVHHEVPSGSDSPHAIQARSTRACVTTGGTELIIIKRRKRRR